MPNGNKHPYSKSSKILPHTKQILMFTDGINDKIRTEINKLLKKNSPVLSEFFINKTFLKTFCELSLSYIT